MRAHPILLLLSCTIVSLAASSAVQAATSATVDSYSPAQTSKAEAAARTAGFSDPVVAMAQGGDLFLKAQKGGDTYMLTVTPDGKVYPSLPSNASGTLTHA